MWMTSERVQNRQGSGRACRAWEVQRPHADGRNVGEILAVRTETGAALWLGSSGCILRQVEGKDRGKAGNEGRCVARPTVKSLCTGQQEC